MSGPHKSDRRRGATPPETLVYHQGVLGAPENQPSSLGRRLSWWLDPGYRGPVLGARAALLRRIPLRRVECPCCGGRFARFQSGWGGSIHSCPRCGSHERHRVLWLYLQQRTNLLTDELAVLHWAPEPGLESNLRALANLSYATADLDPSRATLALDITDIALPADSYDVVLCSHVLEHIEDDRGAMRELLRILRPGGWAIVLVPIDESRAETYEDPAIVQPEERLRAYLDPDHARLYGRDFAARLEQEGFDVTVDRWAAALPDEMIDRHVLSRAEALYVCRKPRGRTERSTFMRPTG
jgi:SAM-dependent methyltransferase